MPGEGYKTNRMVGVRMDVATLSDRIARLEEVLQGVFEVVRQQAELIADLRQRVELLEQRGEPALDALRELVVGGQDQPPPEPPSDDDYAFAEQEEG